MFSENSTSASKRLSHRLGILAGVFLVLGVAPRATVAAQAGGVHPQAAPVATAVRLVAPVTPDGKLDEEVWRTAPAVTGFRQSQPSEGKAGTQRRSVTAAEGELEDLARSWNRRGHVAPVAPAHGVMPVEPVLAPVPPRPSAGLPGRRRLYRGAPLRRGNRSASRSGAISARPLTRKLALGTRPEVLAALAVVAANHQPVTTSSCSPRGSAQWTGEGD